ncbi:MAG: nucleotide-binding protein [Oscillospiraceae bacterium]|nr:nucleotide-binding protein [Oscillospiraceae bacterium]
MRKEMQADIKACSEHTTVEGSEQLMNEIIAKYSIVDPDFAKATCRNGKAALPGKEFDFRKELKAAAARLKSILLTVPQSAAEQDEVEFSELVDQIPQVEKSFWNAAGGAKIIYDQPSFCEWREKIKYHLRKLKQDAAVQELITSLDSFNGWNDSQLFPSVAAKCRVIRDKYGSYTMPLKQKEEKAISGNKIFIVHGHDNEAKISVARTLEQLGLEAVILHEQPDQGKTIIEKLESFTSEAAYAIVLYTECDLGRAKEHDESANRFRARQNVIFEHGLFLGSLGRNRVCALVKGNIEKPGDLDGVVYVSMDDAGAWKMQLCKNMKAVGIDVDANRII